MILTPCCTPKNAHITGTMLARQLLDFFFPLVHCFQ